ncbi:glycoside hydrolase family 65 protein [Geobacter sp. DSM 9736]|uniref:glycoside hydrolase family 65 protein n=1 Tax=Geobacter sp. DSM 9736 TaxID=1277350 RepID=UPI000B50316E|nr:glycosyl hydrolase family 65 protein [Geobacter sp. DSM 9736]SNB46880.1 Trehalose and maltose hydrolase (possible phosphorylase) [Geobacter sp. DSM 9736]
MDPWILVYDSYDPAEEGLREALCTLGNGYFATRGAAPEAWASNVHYPGTYLAGGYNRLKTEVAGRVVENEDLVNLPNWLIFRFKPEGGDWFNLMSAEIVAYRQELDMKQGVLSRMVRYRDRQKRETTVAFRRFVHMGSMHQAAQEITITPENWSGRITVHSGLDGTIVNSGVERYRQLNSKHLETLKQGVFGEDGIYLLVETTQSGLRIAQAARTILTAGTIVEGERRVVEQPGYILTEMVLDAVQNTPLRFEKLVTLFSSRDFAISEPLLDAIELSQRSGGFDDLLRSHVTEWDHLWDRCDINISANGCTQMILRLHIFHLLQTVSRNSIDLDTGVPARGWHGEAYRGHIFWDELFIFPYLNFRIPVLTRSLLLYRYRRLPAARVAARQAGLSGALFPWQSGSTGREETQHVHLNPKSGRWLPDNSHLQRHVNAAIAYNVWHYYDTTGDKEFMATYGIEMILEIARLYASLATWSERSGRHEILGVMGPDEYHDRYPGAEKPGLNNNAYTNVMAVWVLRTALKALDLLSPGRSRDLRESIGLDSAETERWQDVIRTMRVPFHDGDIISQFEEYETLAEFDWEGYRAKYGDIQRLDRILEAEGDTPNRYRVSKQADVIMLFYLFSAEELDELFTAMGYRFEPRMIHRNVEYYAARSSHGSTLSNVVHSWVMARSDRHRAWQVFRRALESDICDIQGGTTHEGIHLGAMAGSVDMIQRCSLGLRFIKGVLQFNPCIPDSIDSISMRIKHRGTWFDVVTTRDSLMISSGEGEPKPVRIRFADEEHTLEPGKSVSFRLENR